VTARRRLAAILAGAVVAGVGGCRSGAPELDVATVRELLLRPGTIPPLPPVGVMPNRIKDVGAACPYLMAGQGDAPVVRRDVCRHLAFFETPGGVRLAALRDPIPRQLVELSPIERPSPDVRIARFTVRWTTEAIDETVRGCFRWVEGAAQARFARVDGKWQLSGFDEVVDRRTEVPCPADGPL
jgi:hypothetical protein